MTFEPTLDRVVITIQEMPQKSAGGIFVPKPKDKQDGEEITSNFGIIQAVGPGGYNQDGTKRKMPFKKGDRVFFTGYSLTETGQGTVIVEEADILAVVKG